MANPANFKTRQVPLVNIAANRLNAFAEHFCYLVQREWRFKIIGYARDHYYAFIFGLRVFLDDGTGVGAVSACGKAGGGAGGV